MDEVEMIILSEISWREKDKYHTICRYVESKNNDTMNLGKTERDPYTQKINIVIKRERKEA